MQTRSAVARRAGIVAPCFALRAAVAPAGPAGFLLAAEQMINPFDFRPTGVKVEHLGASQGLPSAVPRDRMLIYIRPRRQRAASNQAGGVSPNSICFPRGSLFFCYIVDSPLVERRLASHCALVGHEAPCEPGLSPGVV